MTVEIDPEADCLRALLRTTQSALPDYATDPIGRFALVACLPIFQRVRIRPIGNTWY